MDGITEVRQAGNALPLLARFSSSVRILAPALSPESLPPDLSSAHVVSILGMNDGVYPSPLLFASTLFLRGIAFLGSFFFCLSLNFKQMALYYSPAFFFWLLAWAIWGAASRTAVGELVSIVCVCLAMLCVEHPQGP